MGFKKWKRCTRLRPCSCVGLLLACYLLITWFGTFLLWKSPDVKIKTVKYFKNTVLDAFEKNYLLQKAQKVLTGVEKKENWEKFKIRNIVSGQQRHIKDFKSDEIHQILTDSTKLIIIREPYSRLFSGYIAKMFSPPDVSFWNRLGKYAVNLVRLEKNTAGHKCGHDLTFAEFVKYVIHSIYTNRHKDSHFIPMYQLCKPCQIQYDAIAKLETFSDDFSYILDKVKESELKQELKNIYETRIDGEFHGRASLIFKYRYDLTRCMTFFDVQRRVWKRMQIQGYITKKSKYPFSKEESEIITKEDFLKALYDGRGDAINSTVSKANRQEAMDEAYSTIDFEDLKKTTGHI